MNDARIDLFTRLLTGAANRRQFLKSAVGGAIAAGLAHASASAQEPTQTPGPWVLDPTIAKPSDIAVMMPLLGPTPMDWNVEHPERVLLSTVGIHFFDLQSGRVFNVLNDQQVAALPQDTPVVGYWTQFQQPPRGGGPADVGTTLDSTLFFFPALDEEAIPPLWDHYHAYFPGLERKNLGIDSIPNATYVTYEATLADGRQCDVLAGVAQWGPFIHHVNVTAWDGSKPSASALKRVLVAEHVRYGDIMLIAGEPDEILHIQRANPLYWAATSLDGEVPASETSLEPLFITPTYDDGRLIQRVASSGSSDGTRTLDDLTWSMQFAQPYPIPGTEHVMILGATSRLFETPEAASAWFRTWYEDFPDHLPINPEFQAEGRSFFDAHGLQPVEDGMNYPTFHTSILDGRSVLDIEILGGFPIPAEPTPDFGSVLQALGEAARTYYFASVDGGPDPIYLPIEAALIGALDFQRTCSQDLDVCSEP